MLEEPAEERREWGRIPGEARRVEAKDMSFSYERKRSGGGEIESGKAVFKDLDVGLAKGRLTLLKGKSGSGKTTLIKLLLGLYHGDEGREKLCVDGREAPFGQLGVSAAFSEAESAVFCMSVYDNLRMGNENVTKMRCRELFGEAGLRRLDRFPASGAGHRVVRERGRCFRRTAADIGGHAGHPDG